MRDGLLSVDDTSWQGLSGLVDQAVEVLSQETKESMAALSDKTMVFKIFVVVLASELLFSRDYCLRHAAHA